MSNLKFSKGKLKTFVSSKGFYIAVAVCLMGAGVATWLAVDRTITGIEDSNNQIIESENQWNEYPEFEEVEKKQSGVKQETKSKSSPRASSSSSASSSSASSEASEEAGTSSESSAPLEVRVSSPGPVYALPVKSDVIVGFSDGELVKNVTLNDWRTHDSVDFAAEKGTDIMAAADGTVKEIRSDPLWGTVVVLEHGDGKETHYCGLDKKLPVKENEQVLAQQVIGKLEGVPCEISQPSHLHFAVRHEGKWIDPMSVLQARETAEKQPEE